MALGGVKEVARDDGGRVPVLVLGAEDPVAEVLGGQEVPRLLGADDLGLAVDGLGAGLRDLVQEVLLVRLGEGQGGAQTGEAVQLHGVTGGDARDTGDHQAEGGSVPLGGPDEEGLLGGGQIRFLGLLVLLLIRLDLGGLGDVGDQVLVEVGERLLDGDASGRHQHGGTTGHEDSGGVLDQSELDGSEDAPEGVHGQHDAVPFLRI